MIELNYAWNRIGFDALDLYSGPWRRNHSKLNYLGMMEIIHPGNYVFHGVSHATMKRDLCRAG